MNINRGSGILMHITCLPSPYGIGDLGSKAYQFADFLKASGHQYWQILPINPTTSALGNSPYSSFSAFAGNPLLISPELLVKEGFLSHKELPAVPRFPKQQVDFEQVSQYKKVVVEKACANFLRNEDQFAARFNLFCTQNESWLEDYALYLTLKTRFESPWVEWPESIRDRDEATLSDLRKELGQGIKKEKIVQFFFFSQWQRFTDYCHLQGISLIGDIPFYVTHDSADCWANSRYFKLDQQKQPTKVSGVPPDYFSETGQLWGTPVYDWKLMKKNSFDWWLDRLDQNLKLYDWVRLDHFRAFSAFWEVPAKEETAINGKWVACPGKSFFQEVKKRFPSMPFIAEDLGLMDEGVYQLLDKFDFPRMKVLQFAFGENIGENPYILHHHIPNCLVFTGTHDNNTTIGWYRSLKKADAALVSKYIGYDVDENNVHLAMHRLALMSVADLAVIPMQDILGLDERAIMNRPGTESGNWTWRMDGQLWPKKKRIRDLKALNVLYGRWQMKEDLTDKGKLEGNLQSVKEKKDNTMQKSHFQKLLKGKWELENGGPIVDLGENNAMKILKGQNKGDSNSFVLEEVEGMLLLTLPSVIEKSEVMNISPTELVVREYKPGSSHTLIRSFKRLGEADE